MRFVKYISTIIIIALLNFGCVKEPTQPDPPPPPPPPTTGSFELVNKTNSIRIGWIYLDGGTNRLGATAWIYPNASWQASLNVGTHSYVIQGDLQPYNNTPDYEWTGAFEILGGMQSILELRGP